MKVFYVHHAMRKIDGKPTQEDSITRLGAKDAKTMAKMFADAKEEFNITAIYASRFLRCKQTAWIINNRLKVPIYYDDRLNEFRSFENETWEDCQKRTAQLLKEIVRDHKPSETVLCVTSGVNLTAFIAVAFKLKPSNDLPFSMVGSCSPVGFEITESNFE